MTLADKNRHDVSRVRIIEPLKPGPFNGKRTLGQRSCNGPYVSWDLGASDRNRSDIGGRGKTGAVLLLLMIFLASMAGCSTAPDADVYHDPAMDFQALRTVAILPLKNLTKDRSASDLVRDVFANVLLATEAFYVLPSGEVNRGISRSQMVDRTDPSPEETIRLAKIIGADAVITGVLREYGTIRSGTMSVNGISMSLKMFEAGTGTVIWSASSTKSSMNTWVRLFGGGKSMNQVTRETVEELLDSLFM